MENSHVAKTPYKVNPPQWAPDHNHYIEIEIHDLTF